jgi:hypothetical protein
VEAVGNHDAMRIEITVIDSLGVDEIDGFKDLKQNDLPLNSEPFLVFFAL